MADHVPTKPELAKGIYRHYKNKEYKVHDVVLHAETKEWLVLYEPLYLQLSQLVVRPYKMFVEDVTLDGKRVSRFELIREQ